MGSNDGLDKNHDDMLHIETNAGRFTKPVDTKYVDLEVQYGSRALFH